MDPELGGEILETLRRDPLRLALTEATLRTFHIAKQFADNKAVLSSLDYDLSGIRCVTTSLDESLRIYDCVQGTREQVSYSKKYGCNLARFTAQPGCVAYASTKINDTIRYLSYDTNQFIRYFVGHTARVTSLQRSPDQAAILSAALDGTVRIWDLDEVHAASTVTPVCSGGGSGTGGLTASYDPSGTVVAVAVRSTELQLYDTRKLTKGPFQSAKIDRLPMGLSRTVAGVSFIPPVGNTILLSMAGRSLVLVDAFSLKTTAVLSSTALGNSGIKAGAQPLGPEPSDTDSVLKEMQRGCFGQNTTATPDGRVVISGCDGGGIALWDISRLHGDIAYGSNGAENGSVPVIAPNSAWNGSHEGPVGVCAFNPHLLECVSGSQSLTLWTPA
ncbi:hypothetical protein GGF46_004159 [Coemansia sp. RSA 552]|nr:hypothetical protein GGF46_004159 [Coemansia sp. RSA 552]